MTRFGIKSSKLLNSLELGWLFGHLDLLRNRVVLRALVSLTRRELDGAADLNWIGNAVRDCDDTSFHRCKRGDV